jgi:hypothetical protein
MSVFAHFSMCGFIGGAKTHIETFEAELPLDLALVGNYCNMSLFRDLIKLSDGDFQSQGSNIVDG